jgi:hypothetical protein
MPENVRLSVAGHESTGTVAPCPAWCTKAVHGRDWVAHEGASATFTFADPSSRRVEVILRAEIMMLVECEEDLLRDPFVYLECGSPLELDREGLDVYIGGLEGHLRDMRALRDDYVRIISGKVAWKGERPPLVERAAS